MDNNDEDLEAINPPSPEVLKALYAWDWAECTPRLVRFALGVLRQKYWYGKMGGDVGIGNMAQDFVHETIVKVFTGKRKWNMQKCPDLFRYMRWAIKSEISNACKSDENTSFKLTDFKDVVDAEDGVENIIKNEVKEFIQLSAKANSPLENLITVEEQSQAEDRLLGFMTFIEGEEDLTKMFQCIMKGVLLPRDLAKELNITVEEVQNLKKRMRRRYKEYFGGHKATKIPAETGGMKNE